MSAVVQGAFTPARDPAQHLLHVPYTRAAGCQYVGAIDGVIRLRQPFRRAVADVDSGAIDQRAITALLDHACGVAVYTTLAEAAPTATLDLRVAYPQAAMAAEDVVCEAVIAHADAALAIVNATVRNPGGWWRRAAAALSSARIRARAPEKSSLTPGTAPPRRLRRRPKRTRRTSPRSRNFLA